MIAAETLAPKQKLRIKISSKTIQAVPMVPSYQLEEKKSALNDWANNTSVSGRSLDGKVENLRKTCSTPGSRKRGSEESMHSPDGKKRKMDRSVTQQCSVLLKSLMNHSAGWVFNQPVDPVALGIPDYFSIIEKPMDLGTIKGKLVKKTYLSAEDFAADIRLTFSNAMLYNPNSNIVHKMAAELSQFFEERWKCLEEKWNPEKFKAGQGKVLTLRIKNMKDLQQNGPKTPPLNSGTLPNRSKLLERKAEPPKPAQNCPSKSSGKDIHKGSNSAGSGNANGSSNVERLSVLGALKCSTCGNMKCQCCLSIDSNSASSCDVTLERSMTGNHRANSAESVNLGKSTSISQISKSDLDSDGAVSALCDENACLSSQHTAFVMDAAPCGGFTSSASDGQMSPSKALRAALLRFKYADTILKAQQKTLLDHGNKVDAVKMQQEKEKLERRQLEEKLKIEAQIKAAEAEAQLKAENEMKKEREREREAARVALQKMEKTAEIEQNLEILKELEILSGCRLSNHMPGRKDRSEAAVGALEGDDLGNPLQRLGLFIKDDYLDEDIVLNEDGEEGEIC